MRLTETITDKSFAIIDNLGRVLETADFNAVLFNVPVWKHYYHALYWFDYWFAGKENFIGADFRVKDLENIDIPVNINITKEQLKDYYNKVAEKSKIYLHNLTDEMLYDQPKDCKSNRLGLILGQFRHAYCHLGNINCVTIMKTGKWPYVSGSREDMEHVLYDE